MKDLVSVIIPVYNVEKYLDDCLKSILNQKYDNLEIIIVDDGSTDKSGDIAKRYASSNKSIKIVHQKNGGLSSARNTGIKHAHGEWVVFVDSDDYVDEHYVARLIEKANKSQADVVTCSFTPFSDDGSLLKKIPVWPEKIMSGYEAIDDMTAHRQPAYICLSIFRLALFKENNIVFPEGQEYEDIITRIKLLYFAKKVAFLNDRLYYYRIRKDSITGKSFSEKRYADIIKSLNDVKTFLDTNGSRFRYYSYFEFFTIAGLLNSIVRTGKEKTEKKKYWFDARAKMKALYK